MSTRRGGVSRPPYESLNLGARVGDDAAAVAWNRRRVEQALGARCAWLQQVHGTRVVAAHDLAPDEEPQADGSWTDRPGVACVVQAADCLPILLAARSGRAVGAVHAGWRGLALGVVEAGVRAVSIAAGCESSELLAWLGPCIGPRRFEVARDVLDAFGGGSDSYETSRFIPCGWSRDGQPRWLADLAGLARDRLNRSGVRQVTGGNWCTVSDRSRFFSYRRDAVTGRLVGAVWLRGR